VKRKKRRKKKKKRKGKRLMILMAIDHTMMEILQLIR